MPSEVALNINGKAVTLATDLERSLLDVLREDLSLTGTKYGCGEGACRACTVLLEGKPVQSCLTPISAVRGKKVETIEGIAVDGDLHPVQKAFLRHDAMQCGYCVPGMIMSAIGLLRKNPSPTRSEIIGAMNGNLCRCCGYMNLIAAVQDAAGRGRA
jgi:aerobic-type carbon monoxide dehydrogenase small subunit (CoxS/CutS family)